ncbi:hypothetical protein N476_16495 [Pseudoalteromonas luteoviolacea H33]|uniref:Uncharacterized protein n=1 Tax=Pseudoalteromonas luteoviolacea H33 TaxID=1365251 RepID=A0A167EDR0_9GAMM|nr:hypothetical protein N476_16495 [Pseudoalteromonas luteoviolacea H33]KZN77908.1 hypothetical protein N477_10970 [Pseudoalteromonas luteoviolacea H33-S]
MKVNIYFIDLTVIFLSCKRLATVNEVSPLFLRKVNIVRKVCDTVRSTDTLFAQGEISHFNRTKPIALSKHSSQLKTENMDPETSSG